MITRKQARDKLKLNLENPEQDIEVEQNIVIEPEAEIILKMTNPSSILLPIKFD